MPVPRRRYKKVHMEWPKIYPVRQLVHQPEISDPASAVREEILQSRLRHRLRPGSRVAVAVGSRGISQISVLVRSVVATLQELGYRPFIVAAMGSHGGATAEGQRQILASYGITESALGVPVQTDMAVVELGKNSWGEPVYWDRNAYQADGVVAIGRVKLHTDFSGPYQSGLVKMLVIGLGKREGAATHHQYGVRGLRDMIPESAKVVLARTHFVLGLACIENARDKLAVIRAVEPEDLLAVEPQLLQLARDYMARIPFAQLDLLVVGELGKNYSGTGMDVHVLGRQMVEGEPDELRPRITRICVLDLAPESHGNATGVGLADLTTAKVLAKMDAQVSHVNSLTSCFLLRSKIPIDLPTDRECIATGLKTCWQPRIEKVRMALIPNTLELGLLWVSQALAEEAKGRHDLELIGEPRPMPFDQAGNLLQEELFPDSWRARRNQTLRL